MITRSMNKGATPYQWYVTELDKKLHIFNQYYKSSSTLANNCWNHRGEKKFQFIELLIHFIYDQFDNIFYSDSKFWMIKDNIITDITNFLHENTNIAEYAWKGIFQHSFYVSQCYQLHNVQLHLTYHLFVYQISFLSFTPISKLSMHHKL